MLGSRYGLDGFAATAADDHDAVGLRPWIESDRADGPRDGRAESSGGWRRPLTTMVGTVFAFIVLILAFGIALVVVRRFGHALERDANESSVLNKFTEVTSFASDDSEVAATNLVALGRLVKPDASVIHILNRSMDRAVPRVLDRRRDRRDPADARARSLCRRGPRGHVRQ